MTDHNEAMRLAESLNTISAIIKFALSWDDSGQGDQYAIQWPERPKRAEGKEWAKCLDQSDALIRKQAERIAELEKELKATSDNLQDLQSTFDYVRERRAQISHRLWVWAHEELSEPLKTRYFNIVANGKADVMEQPTYAQQYNAQKHRADAAEAECDQLRAEVERLKPNAERYEWLRDNLESEWAICEWQDDPDGLGYYRDARAPEFVDAAIDTARKATT